MISLLETTREGRTYLCKGIYEALFFMVTFSGEILPDYEESLKGNYIVRI